MRNYLRDKVDLEQFKVQHGSRRRTPIRRLQSVVTLIHSGCCAEKTRESMSLNKGIWMAVLRLADHHGFNWRADVLTRTEARDFADVLAQSALLIGKESVSPYADFTGDGEALAKLHAVIEFCRGGSLVLEEKRYW